MAPADANKSMTGSGFEKKGGYSSSSKYVAKLPKAPAGPAPGAKPKTSPKRPG